MMQWMTGALVVMLAAALGYYVRVIFGRYNATSGEREAQRLRDEARREADTIRRETDLQSKSEALKAREALEEEIKKRRQEVAGLEERQAQRELNLDRKVAMLDKKNHLLDQKIADLEKKTGELQVQREACDNLLKTEKEKLQRIAGMTQEEARRTLMLRIEEEVRGETGMLIRRRQEEARQTSEREARRIVATAVQRYAMGHSAELMTSTVTLASDDMKGRIIGREGRNIRALEAATGVDLLVDDTPEAVVISAFDPLRREIARQTLERLLTDGRIHPARIEEVTAKVRDEIEEIMRTTGEEAVYSIGAQGVSPELIRALGRLKFRSSYSQNVLNHSLEVAHLMGVMAGEMGEDVMLAKRIGLFHDIGKSLDSEIEGNHALIGADLLRRQGEPQVLVNAVAAHHEDVAPESVYAVLAAAADAISAARPGARSETSAIYVKRLEKLEEIANSFTGVEKSYAIQAGRELRVLVQADKLDDAAAMHRAREISKKIEQDLQYPGQIKVTVIRETRFVEYAR
ncbi:MAG: ribonuclease Y [Kiritimatiellia bacterium]|nr:ribonuclease Y [Lentisphaerota bacterium]